MMVDIWRKDNREGRSTAKFVSCIQDVFKVEAFLLTCDSMRCSKEF
jgi:hypothetical protein